MKREITAKEFDNDLPLRHIIRYIEIYLTKENLKSIDISVENLDDEQVKIDIKKEVCE